MLKGPSHWHSRSQHELLHFKMGNDYFFLLLRKDIHKKKEYEFNRASRIFTNCLHSRSLSSFHSFFILATMMRWVVLCLFLLLIFFSSFGISNSLNRFTSLAATKSIQVKKRSQMSVYWSEHLNFSFLSFFPSFFMFFSSFSNVVRWKWCNGESSFLRGIIKLLIKINYMKPLILFFSTIVKRFVSQMA